MRDGPLEFPSVVDSTILSSYLACPRKLYWSTLRRLQSAKPSIHLHFGGVFAAGVDVVRQRYYGEHRTLDASIADGFREIALRWGDEELDAFPPKTFYSCVLLLDYYFSEIHQPATDPIRPLIRVDGRPATEFTFALPLDILHPRSGDPIFYAGRFDMLGIYNDSLFVVDEKTTSSLGPTWASQWGLRGQFIGYVYAARSYGYSVAGAIVRGLCIKASGFDHAESIISVPEWMVEEWITHIHHTISSMLRDYDRGYWDKNFDNACTHYGGCQFRTLCETGSPEKWIDAYYVPHNWNPLHKGD